MDKFLIAPLKSGLTTEATSWMISDDAYVRLNNAFIFRGQLKKKYPVNLLFGGMSFYAIGGYYSTYVIRCSRFVTSAG